MSTSSYHTASPAAVRFRELQSDWSEVLPSQWNESEMVGDGQAMARLKLQVRRIGPHFRTVLISGETGTGKELVARALHRASPGASEPFVVCHASTVDKGRLTCADTIDFVAKSDQRGTIFLDGIGETTLEAQAQLLDVLRRFECSHEGLGAPRKTDLRVIASTSEDLRLLATAGRFRQELYQRIAMLEITVPPLRERMEDVPELARHIVGRFAGLYGKSVDGVAQQVLDRLGGYCWPGNVRELENVLRNGVLECEGSMLEAEHLPAFTESAVGAGVTMGGTRLQDVVEQHVLQVLKSCAGNKVRAAELLGISRSTLYRMLDACSVPGTLDAARRHS